MLLTKTRNRYYLFLILLYFIISLVGILHHEIWLDESQHWLLARDSNSFSDIIFNTRYEGHPILWNIVLYLITRFSSNPFWMQLLHILVSAAAVLIFLKKSPFPLLFITLFIFGYFIIFEYNIISRNYILGVLFIFLACSIFKDRDKKFILLCFYLALAANTHLIFGVLSFAILLTILFEHLYERKFTINRAFIYGCLIFLLGLTLSIIQIIPPEDTKFFNHVGSLSFNEKFTVGFTSLFKGLIPIPDFRSIHFWNSNLFVNLSKPITAVFSILVYFVPLILFYKRKMTLFFVYSALLGVQIFFFVTQMSATRFFGMTFLILIVALWIDKYYHSKLPNRVNKRIEIVNKFIIYSILTIQFIAGIIAFSMDIIYPFSSGKDVALFLEENKLSDHTVITPFCEGTIISPYLGKKVFFLCEGSFQSYCDWNSACNGFMTKQEILEKLPTVPVRESMIFIAKTSLLDNPKKNIWYNTNGNLSIKYLIKLDQYIVRNMDYIIYEIANGNY